MADHAHHSLPAEIPVLPLRQSVVFPLTVQPFAVNRPVSVASINRALPTDRLMLLVMQQTEADDPAVDDLRRIGTVGVIRQMSKAPNGLQVLVEGMSASAVESYHREGDVLQARIAPHPESTERGIEVDAYVRRVREQVDKAVSLASGISPDLRQLLMSVEDPLRLVYILATLLDMKSEDKQSLLEQDQVKAKLDAVSGVAAARDLAAGTEGQDRVAGATGDDGRAAPVLPAPAAEGHPAGIRRGRGRQRHDGHPGAHREGVAARPRRPRSLREVDRLEQMPQASPEYQMVRTYIDWVLEIPWSTVTEDRLDPVEARRVLDEDHYDLDKVKERIVEYLAVRKLKGDMKGPILCFVGPPGVGKTSLGQSIARAMNRKFVRISLGGVRDEAEVRGIAGPTSARCPAGSCRR